MEVIRQDGKNHSAQRGRNKYQDDFQEPQGKEYADYIRHVAIGAMGFTPGSIKHCRTGEVIGTGTIPDV